MFFDIYKELCDSMGISPKKAALEIGLSNSVTVKWKAGSTPSGTTLAKIADYFGVSVGYLLGEETEKTPILTAKDERDIARDVERIMNNLEDSGELMFDGIPMSDEAKAAMAAAMRIGLEEAKRRNKETYTPKKYKGE